MVHTPREPEASLLYLAASFSPCGLKLLSRLPTQVGRHQSQAASNVQPQVYNLGGLLIGLGGSQDNLHPVFRMHGVRLDLTT